MTTRVASNRQRILVVEDDASYSTRLQKNLELGGFQSHAVSNVADALHALAEQSFDLVLTDIRMPGRSGLDLVDDVAKLAEGEDETPPPVVILTSVGDIDTAVDAMRRGAADFLTKEATREEIALRLRKQLGRDKLAHEVVRLRRSLDRMRDFDEIVGCSAAMERVKVAIAEIAPSTVTVLITGETGVGKELVARALHRASDRAGEAFVEVNCAALPEENMFLSELFGHERGAFTGAVTRKKGQFEIGDGGTLFLDEVGELGPMAQARLLRAVETQQFNRLGGERPIQVNCRLIFATNRDLEQDIKAERFRSDLFYRINVYPIAVPPLRSRPEDVPALAQFFAARTAERHHLSPISLGADAVEALKSIAWPGNIRELRNVIERLSIRFSGKTIHAADLRELAPATSGAAVGSMVLPEGGIDLLELEESMVTQALERCEFSQRRAAALLGISVDRMNARVKKFGITHPSWRVHKGK